MSFDGIFRNTKDYISKNTPAILTGLSVAGTISTAVLAVQATPKAIRDIMDAESEFGRPIDWKEKVRLTWRYYVPAAAVGTLTIATTLGAQSINHKRQAVLMSAYALTETSFREYREKTREIIGEAKESEIKDEIAKEHLDGVPMVNSEVIITGLGDHLIFDSLSSRYFRSDIETIRAAVNDINHECIHHMNASLNEFYSKIGLPRAGIGDEMGWRHDHLMEVHFSSHIDESGTPSLSIEYDVAPIRGYYKING